MFFKGRLVSCFPTLFSTPTPFGKKHTLPPQYGADYQKKSGRYPGRCGKMPNHSKIAPGGLELSLNKSLIFSEFPTFFQTPLKDRKKQKKLFALQKVQLQDLNFHVFFGKKSNENFEAFETPTFFMNHKIWICKNVSFFKI